LQKNYEGLLLYAEKRDERVGIAVHEHVVWREKRGVERRE